MSLAPEIFYYEILRPPRLINGLRSILIRVESVLSTSLSIALLIPSNLLQAAVCTPQRLDLSIDQSNLFARFSSNPSGGREHDLLCISDPGVQRVIV